MSEEANERQQQGPCACSEASSACCASPGRSKAKLAAFTIVVGAAAAVAAHSFIAKNREAPTDSEVIQANAVEDDERVCLSACGSSLASVEGIRQATHDAGGLATATEYLTATGMSYIAGHQHALVQYALKRVREYVPQAEFLGPTDERRHGPVSIRIPGLSPHTIARGLSDGYGICVRSGYHCCQPLHEYLDSPPTLRAAPYLYNTKEDIDQFAAALAEIVCFHDDATL